MNAVTVDGIAKAYRETEALRGVSFEIRSGEVFSLLGPNGAGKTTTVEILEGDRRRDAGNAEMLGVGPERAGLSWRERIGVVLQQSELYPTLTVEEMVGLFAGYYERPRDVADVVRLVGLEEKRTAKVRSLSGGQKRRLDMAVALAGDPELLFLDEPTTGFDPAARRDAWDIVSNLAALGKTVVLTTHYMDEAQHLAHRVAVMAGGRIVAEGPPATLVSRDQTQTRVRFRPPAGIDPPAEFAGQQTRGGCRELTLDDPVSSLHALTGWALDTGIALDGLEVLRP